jgi:hypothetical protein
VSRLNSRSEIDAFNLITAERQRQIDVEGWSEAHDDEHEDGEMFKAAIFYFANAVGNPITFSPDGAPLGWPWDARWWKPKGYDRDLIRAGALCVAERDRLQRMGADTAHVAYKIGLITKALQINPVLASVITPAESARV